MAVAVGGESTVGGSDVADAAGARVLCVAVEESCAVTVSIPAGVGTGDETIGVGVFIAVATACTTKGGDSGG